MTEQQLEKVLLVAALVKVNEHLYAYEGRDKYTVLLKQVDGDRKCCIPVKRMLGNSKIQYIG